jgi:hypothetical protein
MALWPRNPSILETILTRQSFINRVGTDKDLLNVAAYENSNSFWWFTQVLLENTKI